MNPAHPTPKSSFNKTLLFILVLVLLFVGVSQMAKQSSEPKEIEFSTFIEQASLASSDPHKVVEVTIQENTFSGTYVDGTKFTTYGLSTEDLRKELVKNNVRVNYNPPPQPSIFFSILMAVLPMVLFAFILVWIMRKTQSSGGGLSSFGRSRANLADPKQQTTTFADVAGVDEAKEELQEIVDFLKDPQQFTTLGGKIPKGVLLVGSPGNGKTLLSRAVAGEANVPFFSVSGSEFTEMFVGVGASRVRDLFTQAEKAAPCIIFIDEIDAVGRHRGAGIGGGNDEREQTLNQLLVEMDGFQENKGIIILAATNRADVLDPALLRPGRFDRQVVVPSPDVKGRLGVLKVHTRKTPLAADVNLEAIAKGTSGFSGADLQNLINEAALIGAREKAKEVTNHHLELAKDKVMMGPARKSMIFSELDKKVTAFHEAGHALVARFTEEADPVHKITIVPRGRALGVTMLLPNEDKLSLSKGQAQAMVDYAMGGRAAEEVMFGHFTTGASDDIKKATQIAKRMVCEWGMSDLGPINFNKEMGEDPFLGRDYGKGVSHSEDLSMKLDAAIMDIVNKSYERAKQILSNHRSELEVLGLALIEKETLSGTEIDGILGKA